MKKIKIKLPAFSLAEALITLLIVCLITLASIPVLTKKKRSPNEFASGKWMCTMNSNGQYVVYSSSDPYGDIKDPETWRVSQDGTGCTFVPPQNAKNFGVTVIGGGGGGRDGESKQVVHMDSNKTQYTVQQEDMSDEYNNKYGRFRLAVIGGGGGGHGSDDQDGKWDDNNVGVGGQGGAGAYWIGEIKLQTGEQLTSHVGAGGDGMYDDGCKDKSGYDPNREVQNSFITLYNNVILQAGGGGCGWCTKNKPGSDPKGGGGGIGGELTINNTLSQRSTETYASSGTQASKGKSNGNCKKLPCNKGKLIDYAQNEPLGYYYKDGGYFIKRNVSYGVNCFGIRNGVTLGDYYYGNDTNYYGEGGFGCHGYKKTAGLQGNKGLVRLWQIIEKPGLGGDAAKLAQFTLPSIKGKLNVTIGKGGENNSDGEKTVVDYINNQNSDTPERTLIGLGGTAGAQGKSTSALSAEGGKGQNSLWLNKGGGEVGTCQQGGYKTEKKSVTEQVPEEDANGEPICLVAAYFLGAVDTTDYRTAHAIAAGGYTQMEHVGMMMNCPLNSGTDPKGLCVACDVAKHGSNACKYQYQTDSEGKQQIVAVGANAKEYDAASNFDSGKTYSEYEKLFKKFLVTKWDSIASANLVGYQFDGEYTCLAQKMKTITSEVEESVYVDDYTCSDSGNGTYFGAGGGGGSATSKVGVFGKGGKGAPGAVIVEW